MSAFANLQHLVIVILQALGSDLISSHTLFVQITSEINAKLHQEIPLSLTQIRVRDPILEIRTGTEEQNLTPSIHDPKGLLPLLDQDSTEGDTR